MGSGCVFVLLALFVAFHITDATIFVKTENRLRCKCDKTVSAYVRPAKLDNIQIYPSGIYCPQPEIIVTLRRGRKTICIDPTMKWAEHIVKTMQNRNQTIIS